MFPSIDNVYVGGEVSHLLLLLLSLSLVVVAVVVVVDVLLMCC
jgi:hypothetical protein